MRFIPSIRYYSFRIVDSFLQYSRRLCKSENESIHDTCLVGQFYVNLVMGSLRVHFFSYFALALGDSLKECNNLVLSAQDVGLKLQGLCHLGLLPPQFLHIEVPFRVIGLQTRGMTLARQE